MIDDHAHPFPLEYTAFAPEEVSLDVDGPQAPARQRAAGAGRLFQELMHRALAAFLDLEPTAGDAEVAAARDRAAGEDWGAYVRALFDDAGIDGMLLDLGRSAADAEQSAQAAAYGSLLGRPVWWLARIDPLVDGLVGEGVPAAEVVSAVEGYMAAAASAGAVGYKTIAAYRTGLAVDPAVSLAEAQASLGEDAGQPVRRRAKKLRDLVTRTVLERAADLGRPVQFQTGFGDSDIRLGESNPLLLEDLLRSPAGSAATVVLIHGAYPWHEELAYLATVRPNVYAELSLSNLFAPLGTADRLLRLLELAPRDKVLTGSDGQHLPETHWFACRALADGFAEVARRLAGAGARASFVEATRRAVFEGNARAVYGLG